MCKFRSMIIDAERRGGSSSGDDDPRITPIGRFLRRFKLDEIPQLFNVLSGEMSLVGPRPQVAHDVEKYTAEERAILDVRPGITDWATIWNSDEGAVLAGAADPDQEYIERIRPTKLRLQLAYVRQASLRTDIAILAHTLIRLLFRSWTPAAIRGCPSLQSPSRHPNPRSMRAPEVNRPSQPCDAQSA
jgi:lipopolysaccharide/colanic/teichoic acid biosynthesis glycosyltransferase